MQGAVGAIKSSAATFHAQWLVAGSPTSTTVIKQEGVTITYTFGYPDLAGIVLSAGGLGDYTQAVSATALTLTPDASHASCKVTYTLPTAADAVPAVDASALTSANCK